MNSSNQNNLLDKMTELEEKIQNAEGQINIAQNQKNYYEKQFLDISRELASSILFQKIKSEVDSKL